NGWLDRAVRLHPDKPYLISADDGRELTYAALRRLADRIRAHFAALGLRRNDRVALLANNSLEQLAVYLGALASGVTVCTVHVEANLAHVRSILASLAPRLVIYEEGIGVEDHLRAATTAAIALGTWQNSGGTGFF